MTESIPITEQRNPVSYRIDTKSTLEILQIINDEDRKVPEAVATTLQPLAALVDDVVSSFQKGGRLFYIGAGPSRRLACWMRRNVHLPMGCRQLWCKA